MYFNFYIILYLFFFQKKEIIFIVRLVIIGVVSNFRDKGGFICGYFCYKFVIGADHLFLILLSKIIPVRFLCIAIVCLHFYRIFLINAYILIKLWSDDPSVIAKYLLYILFSFPD